MSPLFVSTLTSPVDRMPKVLSTNFPCISPPEDTSGFIPRQPAGLPLPDLSVSTTPSSRRRHLSRGRLLPQPHSSPPETLSQCLVPLFAMLLTSPPQFSPPYTLNITRRPPRIATERPFFSYSLSSDTHALPHDVRKFFPPCYHARRL